MKQTVEMERWLAERRTILERIKPELRPRNKERQIKSRPTEKRRALAKSCKRAWDNAIQSGKIIKSGNTYKINDLNNPADEYLAIAAQLSAESGHNIIIAGSSAIRFYSANSYLNTTLELFAENTEKVSAALKSAGFKSDAKGCWNSDNSVIQICLIERKNNNLYKETDKIITPLGSVFIVKKEDVILQRIIDGVNYETTSEWAEYLLYTHYENVDMAYLKGQTALMECFYAFIQLYESCNNLKNNGDDEMILDAMKQAANDPGFKERCEEISKDFAALDYPGDGEEW